ncbi:MAG: type I restriction enzyme HsdR N-terminal domain-containing protein [Pseudomonadota bacterium]
MTDVQKSYTTVVDFITGREVPDVGAEANRQTIEKQLVEEKGYLKADIEVDVDMAITVAGEPYRSQIDLVVTVDGHRIMAVKCAAGSLGSREREILAAARLLDSCQIPLAVVTDGIHAIVLDTVSGKKIGEGMTAIPSKEKARDLLAASTPLAFPEKKREREMLVFRTYDLENVNVHRKIT